MENRTKKSMVKLQCPQRESGCHVFTLLHNTCVFTLHAQHTRVHFAACTTHACSPCMHNTRVFTLHAQHTRVHSAACTTHACYSACTTHACSLCCMHNTRVLLCMHNTRVFTLRAQHTRVHSAACTTHACSLCCMHNTHVTHTHTHTSRFCSTTPNGLIYKDFKLGEGPQPVQGQEVLFNYNGYNESGG